MEVPGGGLSLAGGGVGFATELLGISMGSAWTLSFTLLGMPGVFSPELQEEDGSFGKPKSWRFFSSTGERLSGVSHGSSPSTVFDPGRDKAFVFCASTLRPDALGPWEPGIDPQWFFTNRT